MSRSYHPPVLPFGNNHTAEGRPGDVEGVELSAPRMAQCLGRRFDQAAVIDSSSLEPPCPSPHDWPAYHRAVAGASPRASLLAALNGFGRDSTRARSPLAVDLGCGGGTDTVELLRRGWRVLAIDAEPHAIEFLRKRSDLTNIARLETQVCRVEHATWPPPPHQCQRDASVSHT
jgi:SAM-dependent methyltransferase